MALRPTIYQDVRGLFEKTTYDALRKAVDPTTPGVAAAEIFFDNFGETPPGPDVPYALVSLTFDSAVEDVVGCEGVEDLRGTLQCNVYTPKNKGSKPGEGICLNVMKDWLAIKKNLGQSNAALIQAGKKNEIIVEQAAVRNLDGPRTIAPDARPHHVNVVSCAFIARTAKDETTP